MRGFSGGERDFNNTRNRSLHCKGLFAREVNKVIFYFCSVSFLGFLVNDVVE
jgi:hypothetical protein